MNSRKRYPLVIYIAMENRIIIDYVPRFLYKIWWSSIAVLDYWSVGSYLSYLLLYFPVNSCPAILRHMHPDGCWPLVQPTVNRVKSWLNLCLKDPSLPCFCQGTQEIHDESWTCWWFSFRFSRFFDLFKCWHCNFAMGKLFCHINRLRKEKVNHDWTASIIGNHIT